MATSSPQASPFFEGVAAAGAVVVVVVVVGVVGAAGATDGMADGAVDGGPVSTLGSALAGTEGALATGSFPPHAKSPRVSAANIMFRFIVMAPMFFANLKTSSI